MACSVWSVENVDIFSSSYINFFVTPFSLKIFQKNIFQIYLDTFWKTIGHTMIKLVMTSLLFWDEGQPVNREFLDFRSYKQYGTEFFTDGTTWQKKKIWKIPYRLQSSHCVKSVRIRSYSVPYSGSYSGTE